MATIASRLLISIATLIRDYALVRGSYLLGCRVSEIAVIRWKDIEVLSMTEARFTSSAKDPKQGLFAYPVTRSSFFKSLGRGDADSFRLP